MGNKTNTAIWRLRKLSTNDKIILKWQQRFKSETHNVFTEEINKIDTKQ